MRLGANRTLGAGDETDGMRLLAGFESSVEGLGGRGAAGIVAIVPLTLVSRSVAAAVSGGSGGGGGRPGGGGQQEN